jgi:hypothetical protein
MPELPQIAGPVELMRARFIQRFGVANVVQVSKRLRSARLGRGLGAREHVIAEMLAHLDLHAYVSGHPRAQPGQQPVRTDQVQPLLAACSTSCCTTSSSGRCPSPS